VTYVSNIYKYYIAYRLIMEARAAREEAVEKIKSQSKGLPVRASSRAVIRPAAPAPTTTKCVR
jgi:hypothetical protein